jgi:hypothetical protein
VKTYPIPEDMDAQYHGSGWALAAICGGRPVALRYLNDVASDDWLDKIERMGQHAKLVVGKWILSPEAGPHVRELSAFGEVSIGMCSCHEFVEM